MPEGIEALIFEIIWILFWEGDTGFWQNSINFMYVEYEWKVGEKEVLHLILSQLYF